MIEEIKGLGSFPNILFKLQQKNIKNMILKVKDKNHIYISFPYGVGIAEVVDVVERRKVWIKKMLEQFSCEQKEQIYNHGWIYHLGNIYKITYAYMPKTGVRVDKGEIRVYARGEEEIEKVVQKWQKNEAQRVCAEIIALWEEKIGIKTTHLSIKRMSSRWGSCNPKKGYINLNLSLIKMPKEVIEYVVVHELTHFFFYYHDKDFYLMMSRYLPQWEKMEAMLREWRRRVS